MVFIPWGHHGRKTVVPSQGMGALPFALMPCEGIIRCPRDLEEVTAMDTDTKTLLQNIVEILNLEGVQPAEGETLIAGGVNFSHLQTIAGGDCLDAIRFLVEEALR